MQLQVKTVLNRVHPLKHFVYDDVRFVPVDQGVRIEATVVPRANSKPLCSECMKPAPGYDRLGWRRFHFIPLWSIAVLLLYRPRRVQCPVHGVIVEHIPWSNGKSPMTIALMNFLAAWAKRLSWWETGRAFGFSWDMVRMSVEWVVHWGLEHRDLSDIDAIGIDEVAYRKRHKYMTVVYDLSKGRRRLLWISENHTQATLKQFLTWFGPERCGRLRFVCSDMWHAYVHVVARRLPHVMHVLDRFHIVKNLNDAVDQTRRAEAAELRRKGDKVTLSKSRWCLLKRVRNLTYHQSVRLHELLKINLRTMRAYLMKEDFDRFWQYVSPAWAGKFLDSWCTRAMRSRIDPMKRVATTLRLRRELILNYFRAKKQLNSGAVEGMNNKLKLVTRRSYGYRSAETLKIAMYHALGDLPTPPQAHEFA
jgi:transposase